MSYIMTAKFCHFRNLLSKPQNSQITPCNAYIINGNHILAEGKTLQEFHGSIETVWKTFS